MRAALAYRPGRDPLHAAAAPAAFVFLFSFALLSFVFWSPIVIGAVILSACLIGFAAGVGRTVVSTLRWGLAVALLMTIVNGLVTDRGDTVLARLGSAPVLGQVNITLESLATGATIGLRVLATLLVFAVYSACVNPDELLRLLRPIARRSALTASLVTRLVPVAASDLGRLREASALRGPGAAPVGKGAMARRILAGSLDRSVDVAATLELRGYSLPSASVPMPLRRSRHDRRFYAAATLVAVGGIAAGLAGLGEFDTYPRLVLDTDAGTLALAVALPLIAIAPFWIGRPR
ncbi:MAG: energy-coupling factor transport system permease protein [Pseudonocardiales bacterium]|nr:energy-coupling factor transport system permease protein [Pseudonocardiales bacterium]